jgi:hypothetical protein
MSDGNPKSSPDNPGIGQMRGGLIFLKTKDRPSLVKFYMETIQMKIWLEQPDITIMSHGNFLLGLHHKPDQEPEIFGMYTFVYPSKEEVDEMYDRFGLRKLPYENPTVQRNLMRRAKTFQSSTFHIL